MFNLRVKQIELICLYASRMAVCTHPYILVILLGSDTRSVTRGDKLVWPDLQLKFILGKRHYNNTIEYDISKILRILYHCFNDLFCSSIQAVISVVIWTMKSLQISFFFYQPVRLHNQVVSKILIQRQVLIMYISYQFYVVHQELCQELWKF